MRGDRCDGFAAYLRHALARTRVFRLRVTSVTPRISAQVVGRLGAWHPHWRVAFDPMVAAEGQARRAFLTQNSVPAGAMT